MGESNLENRSFIGFTWWNLRDFAHFDPSRSAQRGWPAEASDYTTKSEAVAGAIRDLKARHAFDIFGACEITRPAAEGLRTRCLANFDFVHQSPKKSLPGIAVFFRKDAGFEVREPLSAAKVVDSTRSMIVLDHMDPLHEIRFVFCHWTAFGTRSGTYRERLAETLSAHLHSFLHSNGHKKQRHAVVLGDLNLEPFDPVFETRLLATRDRAQAIRKLHRADHQTQRVRLYNASWRLLGERHPHDVQATSHSAGTYYGGKSWHTYDQVLVTGSLVGSELPFLEESGLAILHPQGALDSRGIPAISNHLPLAGRIALVRSES